jgi:hypothetical protein
MATEKIFIQIDDNRIELTGADLEAFQSSRTEYGDAIKADLDAKAAAKSSAVAKLTALGLTEDEAKAIIG